MKTIIKRFSTKGDAERHQERLYTQYDYVRLVRWPWLSEDGVYAWEVQ